MNDLSISIYTSGTTLFNDVNDVLENANGLYFETGYPGGLYLAGGFFLPSNPFEQLSIKPPYRCVIRDDITIVFEGFIPSVRHVYSEEDSGIYVPMIGAWGFYMTNRLKRKRWADDRTDEQSWSWSISAAAADKCTIDRRSRLYFVPKAESWTSGEVAGVRYDMPNNETVKLITYDYDLQEAGQAWRLRWFDSTNGASNIATTSGAGTTNYILPFPTQTIYLQYRSDATQTPTSDGTYYGKISNLKIYSENETTRNNICLYSICEDIISAYTTDFLNSETGYLTQMGSVRTVEPFISSGDTYESPADIVTRAAQFGDGNDDPWAVYIGHSELATTPNGKGVLVMEAYPDVTASAYEYIIYPDGGDNIEGSIELELDYFSELVNNIAVEYRDAEGFQQFVFASDSTSIADNGRRSALYNIGNSTSANATNYANRMLARNKDPKWIVKAPINIVGYIEGGNGEPIPASKIKAGTRLKIDGYGSNSHLISRTRYDDETQTCSIEVGQLPQIGIEETVFAPVYNDPTPTKNGGRQDGRKNAPWYRRADVPYSLKKKNREEWLRLKREFFKTHRR